MKSTDLPFGVLASHSFSEWVDLFEGPSVSGWKGEYGSSQVFTGFLMEGEWDTHQIDASELLRATDVLGTIAWLAVATTFGRHTVHPSCSTKYILLREIDGNLRTGRYPGYGGLDCIPMKKRVLIEKTHLPSLKHNSSIICELAKSDGYLLVDQLLTCFYSASSQDDLSDRWIDFVANLELMFNPDGIRPLKQTFRDRFAASLSTDDESPKRLDLLAAKLFDYRSRVFHGLDTEMDKSLQDMLGAVNYPFPIDIIRRVILFLVRNRSEIHELGFLKFLALDKKNVPDQEHDKAKSGDYVDFKIIKLKQEDTTFRDKQREFLLCDLPDRKQPLKSSDSGNPHDGTSSMIDYIAYMASRDDTILAGEPDITDFVTEIVIGEKDELGHNLLDSANRLSGLDYTDISGDDVVVFIPFCGVSLSQPSNSLPSGHEFGTLPYSVWSSLQIGAVRDVYGPGAMFTERNFLQLRFRSGIDFLAGEGREFFYQLIGQGRRDLDDRVLSFLLGLLIGDSGNIVNPFEAVWHMVQAGFRTTTSQRFSYYSLIHPDRFAPRYLKVTSEERCEVNEMPSTIMSDDYLETDGEGVERADRFANIIMSGKRFELPQLRGLALSFCRSRSSVLLPRARLSQLILTFEQSFGPLSSDKIERTYRRLITILSRIENMEKPEFDQFAESFRHVRNAVAHGRYPEESFTDILGFVDIALRSFLALALSINLPKAMPLNDRKRQFKMIKAICFDEKT